MIKAHRFQFHHEQPIEIKAASRFRVKARHSLATKQAASNDLDVLLAGGVMTGHHIKGNPYAARSKHLALGKLPYLKQESAVNGLIIP